MQLISRTGMNSEEKRAAAIQKFFGYGRNVSQISSS